MLFFARPAFNLTRVPHEYIRGLSCSPNAYLLDVDMRKLLGGELRIDETLAHLLRIHFGIFTLLFASDHVNNAIA